MGIGDQRIRVGLDKVLPASKDEDPELGHSGREDVHRTTKRDLEVRNPTGGCLREAQSGPRTKVASTGLAGFGGTNSEQHARSPADQPPSRDGVAWTFAAPGLVAARFARWVGLLLAVARAAAASLQLFCVLSISSVSSIFCILTVLSALSWGSGSMCRAGGRMWDERKTR